MTRTPPVDRDPSSSGATSPGATDYSAHPFLDPDFRRRDPHAFRAYVHLLRENMRSPWRIQSLINRLLHPAGEEHSPEVNQRILGSYLRDAGSYVRGLVGLLPPREWAQFLPDHQVESCNDFRELVELLLAESDSRRSFEVRRKLYLAKLLIQIDRTRMVQDGPRHKRYLSELFDRELWAYVREARDREISYRSTGGGVELVSGSTPRGPIQWYRFPVRRVVRELPGGPCNVEIFNFSVRFKRDVTAREATPNLGDDSREYPPLERTRSASILSKMLRKRINNPDGISDMLGARFVVRQQSDVRRLAEVLHQILGGPLAFRNQVDLFHRPDDHRQLNRYSSGSFRVFKEDVDILYPPRGGEALRPYLFGVELQIFTVESYLQTLHGRDSASHRRYKRRQFLRGVLPYVFPASIYGTPRLRGRREARRGPKRRPA